MLLAASGDAFCRELPALFQAAAYHRLTFNPSSFLHLFTESSHEISSLPYPLLQYTYSTLTPRLCVSIQFLIYCSVFFLLWGGKSVFSGGYANLSQEKVGEHHVMLSANLLVCPMSLKQVWSCDSWHYSPPVFSV
jgi:hypothetical protein